MSRARGALHFLGCAAVVAMLAHPAYCQITTATVPNGITNEAYPATVINSNFDFQVSFTTSGILPPGLMFSDLGNNNAEIFGTPTAAGSYTFMVVASEVGVGVVGSQSYTIQIVQQLVIPPTSLATAMVGMPYSQQLQTTGGTPPYTWSLGIMSTSFVPMATRRGHGGTKPAATPISGSLPPGLQLSSSGLISGTPTQAGGYSFNVTVSDSSSILPQSTIGTFSILVSPLSPLLIETLSPLPAGTVGQLYSIPLRAQGGAIPYTWTLTSGTRPPGLLLGGAGSLTGTPTQAGTFTFTLTVTDQSGNTTNGSFTLVIAPGFSITTQSLPPGAVGVMYSAPINVTPTTGPYTFSVSGGTLPAKLALSPTSVTPAGTLSGTPTTAGSYTFTITATDSAGLTASQSYTVVIAAPPITITPGPGTLPQGTLGATYSQPFKATGGAGGYVFSIGSGAPPGIGISSAGVLSGTPTATGTFSFTVIVVDSQQTTVTQTYQLTIVAAPVSTPTVTGVGSTAPPAQQPTLSLELAQSYPTDLTGTVALTFASAVGNVDDPVIQFSTGGRTVTFTIPAGQKTAVFPAAALSLDTGTVAGTITLTLDFKADGQDVTPQPAPTQTITIAPQAPVITKVAASSNSGGIEVDVTGFSNTREMVSATFTFQAASGTTLQGGTQTITVGPIFATWYGDPGSAKFGSEFTFAQPFNLSGSATGVASVSVTLTNTVGTSTAVVASVP